MAPGKSKKSDGANGSSATTKSQSRPQDERRRKRLRVEKDSDEDVQILEDEKTGLPSGRTSQKFADVDSDTNKSNKEPEASGKRGRSDNSGTGDKTKAEHKGKGKMWFQLLVSLTSVCFIKLTWLNFLGDCCLGLKSESQQAAEEADPSTTMVDYYKILEIQRTASTADIKKS